MTHPTDQQWMAYVYGELDKKSQATLAEHLHSCRDCRRQLAAWQSAMTELDTWQVSDGRARRRGLRPLVKWGVAAALLLAVGFAAGRLAPWPSADARPGDQLQASLSSSLESAIRESVSRELSAGMAAELSKLRADLGDDFHKALEGQTEQLMGATVLTSRYETLRLLGAFAERYELARMQDSRLFAEALGRLHSRYVSEHAALRDGLGVLALLTEDELVRMEEGIGQLLARQMPAGAASEVENVSHTPDNP